MSVSVSQTCLLHWLPYTKKPWHAGAVLVVCPREQQVQCGRWSKDEQRWVALDGSRYLDVFKWAELPMVADSILREAGL